MSKLETPKTRRFWEREMTHRFWEREGGTLLLEFLAVSGRGVGTRLIDAVIVRDGDHRIASRTERVSLDGHDIVIVQTKAQHIAVCSLSSVTNTSAASIASVFI
jgi:hypothetical protein